jgi:hypothetical protein
MAVPVNLTHLVPPDLHHPSVLGRGAAKMVWFTNPGDEWLIMNAHPSQVYDEDDDQALRLQKMDFTMYQQKIEFLFTHAIRAAFPLMIPEVRTIEPNYRFQDSAVRFRYRKQRCQPLPLDGNTFGRMIGLVEMLGGQNLVYLDIKPPNLGMLQGNLCIIDTDPNVFYRVPPAFRVYFLYAQYITIVFYSFHFVPEIDKALLRTFVNTILTPAICDEVFAQDLNPHRVEIATENLAVMAPILTQVRVHQPRAHTILEDVAASIQLPMEFMAHYGTRDGIPAREKLEMIRNWVYAPPAMNNL